MKQVRLNVLAISATGLLLGLLGCTNPSSDPFKGDEQVEAVVENAINPDQRIDPASQEFCATPLVTVTPTSTNQIWSTGSQRTLTWNVSLIHSGVTFRPSGGLVVRDAPTSSQTSVRIDANRRGGSISINWNPTRTARGSFTVELGLAYATSTLEQQFSCTTKRVNIEYESRVQGIARPRNNELPGSEFAAGRELKYEIIVADPDSDATHMPTLSVVAVNNEANPNPNHRPSVYKYSIGHRVDRTTLSRPTYNASTRETRYEVIFNSDALMADLRTHFSVAARKADALRRGTVVLFADMQVGYLNGQRYDDIDPSTDPIPTPELFRFLGINP